MQIIKLFDLSNILTVNLIAFTNSSSERQSPPKRGIKKQQKQKQQKNHYPAEQKVQGQLQSSF